MNDLDEAAEILQYQYTKTDMTTPFIRVYTHRENPNIPMGSRVVVHVVLENWLSSMMRPKKKAESEYVTV